MLILLNSLRYMYQYTKLYQTVMWIVCGVSIMSNYSVLLSVKTHCKQNICI